MRAEFLKEVWKLRFEIMLKIEKDSVGTYQWMLKEYHAILAKTGADKIMDEIIKDEIKHTKLAETLCRLASEIIIPLYETDESD